MKVRGIRGATTANSNTEDEIINSTKTLIMEVIAQNGIDFDDIVSIYFTMTSDLDAAFPAKAVREMGLLNVPLLDGLSPAVKDCIPKCIRLMMHINTEKTLNEIIHVYLNDAVKLRPDLIR